MKTLICFLSSLLFLMSFTNCKNTHVYDKYVKELDSLKVVVEQSVANFKTIDSIAVCDAYYKQYTYTDFINKNLKDTVSKAIADHLQAFYLIGKNMSNFLAMHSTWISEAQTSIKQLSNLSHDLKNGSIEQEEAIEFINEEKKEAEKIIEELKVNSEIIRNQMEVFAKTIGTAEETIKKINGGQLPEVIKPRIHIQLEAD